jgi:hypothetical protein
MREYAGPELAEDFKSADWAEVFDVTEFSCFGQWDKPALFPEIQYMLGGP